MWVIADPLMQIVLISILATVVVIGGVYLMRVYVRRRAASHSDDPPQLPARGILNPTSRLARAFQTPSPMTKIPDREVQLVVDWLAAQAFEQTGQSITEDAAVYIRLIEAAQQAVQDLKTQDPVTVTLPFLHVEDDPERPVEVRLTNEVIKELARY